MPPFVPGLELARAYYEEVVAEIVGETPHAAARIGWGSEVVGFDTERSTDHAWGPQLQVFVAASEVERLRAAVDAALPSRFRGWPTRFGWDDTPVTHHVDADALETWLGRHLGFDPLSGVTTLDWLATPQQTLLEVTAGAVFHDATGDLTAVREALRWYPEDLWLWLMACQWRRIDQEEPFVGRAAEVGDELGSTLVASRLVRDVVRLCFLQERRYAPYSKWLGSAFRRLDAQDALGARLLDALQATDFGAREGALAEIVERLAARHNALGLTTPVDEGVQMFHGRPFRVLGSSRFVAACLERVTDPWLRALPLTGAVDQWVDSTDVLSESSMFPGARAAYDSWARPAT